MTTRAVPAVAGALLTGLLAITACGDDGPSADEARVCGALQDVVDDLAAGRSQEAIDTLDELGAAVSATSNEDLRDAGASFFDDLFTDVDRFELTIDESVALGQRYLDEASASLGGVLEQCAAAGAELQRLPSS